MGKVHCVNLVTDGWNSPSSITVDLELTLARRRSFTSW